MLSNKTVINTINTQPVCYVLLLIYKDLEKKKEKKNKKAVIVVRKSPLEES